MPQASIIIQTEAEFNEITFSKNYRIFGHDEPIYKVVSLATYADSISLNGNVSANLTRKFRYSSNKYDWSLWYPFSTSDYEHLKNLPYDSEKPLFLEVKVGYDDGSYDSLAQTILVEGFKIVFNTNDSQPTKSYQFRARAANEGSPAIAIDKTATFRPYAVNEANQMHIGMSYQTNLMFGHEVVYFRTLPDLNSGDFVFKEWTIQDTVEKKCIKVLVPNNDFPDSKPKFNEFGIDFEVPFEIHIDNSYFQAIFGKGAQPRVRDFMYFPMMDRMYEIKSNFLYKGFMMEPIYWKIALSKYTPSIDMTMDKKYEDQINSIVTSAEELFGKKVDSDIKNATLGQQFKTSTQAHDEVRKAISEQVDTTTFNKTYTYLPLIDRFYNMSNVMSAEQTFLIESLTDKNRTELIGNPVRVRAYEDSPIFTAWRQGFINSHDLNVLGTVERYIKISGPHDSHSDSGRYIDVIATNGVNLERERATQVDGNKVTYRGRNNALLYKVPSQMTGNITVSCLFKLQSTATGVTFINGYSNETQAGVTVGWKKDSGKDYIVVKTNTVTTDFELSSQLNPDTWYGIVVPISSQFKQVGAYIYGFQQDPANAKNWNKMVTVFGETKEVLGVEDFYNEILWSLPAGYYSITNIRVFTTMIQEEDHEFMLSQQIIRDAEATYLVDNCKDKLELPYISLNR